MDSNATDTSTGGRHAPPLVVITDTDQSGILIIAGALGLVFAVISILIRLFIRYEFSTRFAKDDVACFASMVFAITQAAIIFAATSRGFGKTLIDIPDADEPQWQKDLFASDIMYIITMWLTKCSVAFLFLRLSPDRVHIVSAKALLLVSTLFMAISILVVSVRCDVAQPWIITSGKCASAFPRWIAVTVFDILSEIGLFGLALLMVQGLQLPLQKKLVVMVAFGFRLPVIAASIIRLSYIGVQLTSTDPSINGIIAAVCTQVEICYAIVATTTPCLKPFMAALNTNYGGTTTINTPSGTKVGYSGNDISLGSMSPPTRIRLEKDTDLEISAEAEASPPPPRTRWDGAEYNVEVNSGDQGSVESNDSGRMIIAKNTSWTVGFEQRGSPA